MRRVQKSVKTGVDDVSTAGDLQAEPPKSPAN